MSQTQSSSYMTGLRDDLTSLAIDAVRARHIDAQSVDDEVNIPDQADFRYSLSQSNPLQAAPGGVPLQTWAMIGGLVVVGVFALKKFI